MKDHGQNPDKGIKAGAAPVSFNEVEKLTEEKYTIRKYKRILFYVVICVLLAAFLLGQYIYPSEREPVTEESITYTGTFYRVLADGTKEEIPVPGKCDVPAGEPLVIRSVLPQDYHENTIAIRTSLENVRIYIGGELRAVYDTENTRPFGKNSASRYVFCETSGEDAGKEVRIELQSFTDKYSGVVNTVYCGDKSDIWAYMFHCYFMVTLIACAMLFAGLVVLIISLVLDIIYKTRFDLEYLGWCMLLGAVWMLGESKLRQLFVSNASILSNMCFFVVMLCPVPIMFYIDSVQQGRYRKVYHVAECITYVNFVLCTALQVLNIADFISTMFLSHMVIAGTFLTIFITICRDLIQGTAKHYKLPLIGLVAAMIAVMLEVTAVYRVVSLSGIFIATGLVVLLVVTLIQTMDRIRELELARQREARESLDYLTGLPMRHKGEKLILEKMQEHDGCLGFVDMDNLKKINDVYGHKAGDRALRICLEQPEIFKTQLRALLRAAKYGTLAIMYPMIISVEEVLDIQKIVAEVAKELEEEKLPYTIPEQGIMIETPAAVMMSEELAEHVDFFSIGTNDLTQYTLAIDRQNNRLDRFYNPHHEPVLRMIQMTVDGAHKHGKWVGICGELGADTTLTTRFVQMGIDELSVAPSMVLNVRSKICEME